MTMKDIQKEHNDKSIDYSKLNKLYEYFVLQKQLSVEQVYWLPVSKPSLPENVTKPTLTQVFRKKQPTNCKVYANLKNEKDILDNFDACIRKRTVLTGVKVGIWGVMHIKGAFEQDVIPFLKNLRKTFKHFEMGLYREVHEMKGIFKQMEDEVDQYAMEKKYFEFEKKQLLINNDRLLEENISCDIMCTFLHSLNKLDNYGKCKSLDIVLLDQQESNKSFSKLTNRFAKLKKYCISLKRSLQHNKEKMICNESWKTHYTSLITEINNKSFEINDLKAQFQDKLIVVNELKQRLAQLHGKSQMTQCESPNFYSRIQKIEDENVSLAFQVFSLSKEREHLS
ncbi:hypothetical protein Tco_1433518 [Tanacetum coccineum]